MAQSNLSQAKNAKNDEFYTQYHDIEKEIEAYLEYDTNTFKGKVIYCNCDDPFESNFFRYFVLNFNKLGLKQLISTSYKPSPIANTQLGLFGDDETIIKVKGRPKVTANKFIINEVRDIDGDGEFNLKDIALQLKANKNNEWAPIEGDGDFRSQESVNLLKQADIVVTNPPFSLFREYVAQLIEHNKKFLIIGNQNAITYKEIFSLIEDNKIWLGHSLDGRNVWFRVPDSYETYHKIEDGIKYAFVASTVRFTNLEHKKRHEDIILYKTYKGNEKNYPKYDNYNAINIDKAKDIPVDYNGVMGVPITFMHKYNPEQFEIVGRADANIANENNKYHISGFADKGGAPLVGGKFVYKRILIRRKQ